MSARATRIELVLPSSGPRQPLPVAAARPIFLLQVFSRQVSLLFVMAAEQASTLQRLDWSQSVAARLSVELCRVAPTQAYSRLA